MYKCDNVYKTTMIIVEKESGNKQYWTWLVYLWELCKRFSLNRTKKNNKHKQGEIIFERDLKVFLSLRLKQNILICKLIIDDTKIKQIQKRKYLGYDLTDDGIWNNEIWR